LGLGFRVLAFVELGSIIPEFSGYCHSYDR
jgi:hypothetical protein